MKWICVSILWRDFPEYLVQLKLPCVKNFDVYHICAVVIITAKVPLDIRDGDRTMHIWFQLKFPSSVKTFDILFCFFLKWGLGVGHYFQNIISREENWRDMNLSLYLLKDNPWKPQDELENLKRSLNSNSFSRQLRALPLLRSLHDRC